MSDEAVVGVDGCRSGWIAIIWDEVPRLQHCTTFEEVLDLPGRIVAVDIPIGLPEKSGRMAEVEARRLVGDRRSSIFPVPSRAAVMCENYEESKRINKLNSSPPVSVQIQFHCLSGKVRQVDACMIPALQSRIFETHPELAFNQMNKGKSLRWSKKKAQGKDERRLLLTESGFPFCQLVRPEFVNAKFAEDDVIDACACAWVARRILRGIEMRVPVSTDRDARGLRMEINA